MITDAQIIHAIEQHGSQRKAALALGLNSRTVERRLAAIADRAEAGEPRILILDIETRPLLAYTWSMFQANIGPSQVVDWGGMMCFAAKWADEDSVLFHAEWQGGHEVMVRAAHRLMDEADALVGWNSDRFDIRHMQAEFQKAGLRRPLSFRKVDLMRSQKRDANFPSNKLESRRRILGKGGKLDTGGFELWRACMDGDRESRRLMQEYNTNDVLITAEEYEEMRAGGWLRNLPNRSIDGGHVCANCGSDRLQAVKDYRTDARRYAQWLCLDCGTASRETKCRPGSAAMKAVA